MVRGPSDAARGWCPFGGSNDQGPWPTEHGGNPGTELPGTEWFREVVIGPGLEALEFCLALPVSMSRTGAGLKERTRCRSRTASELSGANSRNFCQHEGPLVVGNSQIDVSP